MDLRQGQIVRRRELHSFLGGHPGLELAGLQVDAEDADGLVLQGQAHPAHSVQTVHCGSTSTKKAT